MMGMWVGRLKQYMYTCKYRMLAGLIRQDGKYYCQVYAKVYIFMSVCV